MKKGTVFFHPIDQAGALTISWASGPKGDAVEAKKGDGVGFFSDTGDLLCVIFDEVQFPEDHQRLEFASEGVEVQLKNGKITYRLFKLKKKSTRGKKGSTRRLTER